MADLRRLGEGKHWSVDQAIADLESLTPVRGHIHATHLESALDVSTEAETIVTLCCARCLQQFNHPLRVEVREMIELRGCAPSTAEGALAPVEGDLDDRLDPSGSFDPERWLFEQLSLRLPLVNRCGEHCPGPSSWGSSPAAPDPRWAALRELSPQPFQSPT